MSGFGNPVRTARPTGDHEWHGSAGHDLALFGELFDLLGIGRDQVCGTGVESLIESRLRGSETAVPPARPPSWMPVTLCPVVRENALARFKTRPTRRMSPGGPAAYAGYLGTMISTPGALY